MYSFFEPVPLAPPDPILGLTALYQADNRKEKVNLGVGYYRDETFHTPIFSCVKQAEKVLWESESNKEYLSIDGHTAFLEKIGELIFGRDFWHQKRHQLAACQTLGGTGALKLGGTLFKEYVDRPVFLPSPTWPNHPALFKGCHLSVDSYPYYDAKTASLQVSEMLAHMQKQNEGSLILLHPSCHNPTGCDLSPTDGESLAKILLENKLIPFFDLAYQGMGLGLVEDVALIRHLAERGCEMFIAFSASKNFSLYAERVGALFFHSAKKEIAARVLSRLKQLVRISYSNPPKHGVALVAHILCEADLRNQWEKELAQIRRRIQELRSDFAACCHKKQVLRDVSFIEKGHGLFCQIGLTKAQVDRLISEYGIYMPFDGRMNVCGLNRDNIDYVVDALATTRE